LVHAKVGAKHELLFNKPASELEFLVEKPAHGLGKGGIHIGINYSVLNEMKQYE
jgi:hypothetical protein